MHDCFLIYSLVKYSARYHSRKAVIWSYNCLGACTIDLPATFLTENHVVQIGFDQLISNLASLTREIWEREYQRKELQICKG